MAEQRGTPAIRPGQEVVDTSGAHAGIVIETRPPLMCVVTLRGQVWLHEDMVREVTGGIVHLTCALADLERYQSPDPHQPE
jgi:hypothetical protein